MYPRVLRKAALATVLVAPVVVAGGAGLATAAPTVSVLAKGLNAPKHLTIGPDGNLYVAESGTGGNSNCAVGPKTEGVGTTSYCDGPTGSIVQVSATGQMHGAQAGLPSVVEKDTEEALGPAAVAFNGSYTAVVFQNELVGKTGANGLKGAAASMFGTMVIRDGSSATVAHITAFAAAHPQAAATLGGIPHSETTYDSDPYDVVAYDNGFVVADAAANDLLSVSDNGTVHLLARFPAEPETLPAKVLGNPKPETIDAQAVPTAVAVGPDGALYVGMLRGVPSDPGSAQIYRVVPGQAPTVFAKGLTAVTAIAFDGPDLLATEYSVGGLLAPPTVPGALVEVSPNGESVTTLPVRGLSEPTGVAVGAGGTVYVANDGDSPASAKDPGEILAIKGLP